MNCGNAKHRLGGLTRAEVLIILASVFILLLLTMPALNSEKGKSLRVKCTGALKQVALGLTLWANDHHNRFPFEVSVSDGGSREDALAGSILPSFVIASNQLHTPGILFCPEDKKRQPAESFSSLRSVNVSYFLNADAAMISQTNTQNHVLVGDRNLTIAGSPVQPGLLHVTNSTELAWAKWLHKGGGNVALIDGSAHQSTTIGFHNLLKLGNSTNRFVIP